MRRLVPLALGRPPFVVDDEIVVPKPRSDFPVGDKQMRTVYKYPFGITAIFGLEETLA